MIAVPHDISSEGYLAMESQSRIRHEYRYGLVYAMAGGTDNQDRIALNLLTLVNLHLGDSACRFHSDTKSGSLAPGILSGRGDLAPTVGGVRNQGFLTRIWSDNVKMGYQDALYYYPDAFVTCDPRDREDR